MAQILKSLSLDVSRQNRVRTILAKQFDNNSRFLKVQLNNEGEPIVVEKDSIVLINATREDGKSDSFFGYVNDDGSVTVPISYWMLEVTGKVKCDISVISEQGSKLSTLSFAIEVEKTNGCGESIEEHENCGILVQLISDVKQLEEKFKTVFIRYSANADGDKYSDIWSEGMEYIGIANADSEPADKSGYVWCRFAVPKESNNITVDSELSLTSENPVQNKVIKAAFDSTNRSVSSIFQRQEEMGNHLDSLQNQVDNMGGGGSGGVSSWNDLTDKPFDDNVTTIFDGVLQDTQSGDTWMGEPSAEDTSDAALVVGQTYTYTWDGKEYTSVCFSFGGINCIGNNGVVTGVDNGHPVLISRHPTKWEAIVVNNRNDTDGTYSLKITTAIKQLDNKYLEPFERQVGDVTEFLPSCKGATTYSSDYGVYGLSTPSTVEMFARWHGIDESIAPIEGNIFVEFDGVTYECAQQRLAALDYAMAIGNCTPFGGTGNNEPFVVTIMQNGNFYTWLIACLSDTSPTEHTARVYQSTPDKWLLKEQYLPDGIGGAVTQPVSIDLSGLDTSGTIVETYADGTTKTTSIEFDANGTPTKITDGDGNVTTLTW